MDSKIKKIVELCGFTAAPYWKEFEKIFSKITFEEYNQILQNKDMLILDKINNTAAQKITSSDQFYKQITIDEKTSAITMNTPILVTAPISIPEYCIHIHAPIYLGEGSSLTNTKIYDTTWIEPHAKIEHSVIQPGNGHSFIGSNTIVSNVHELKGTFISGGPLRKEGRSQIYMHAFASINMLIGAYSAPSIGLVTYNHPLGSDLSIVIDPETFKPHEFPQDSRYRKLATLLGYEAELGANVLLNSGTVIGAKSIIPSGLQIDGLVYRVQEESRYFPAREAKQLKP